MPSVNARLRFEVPKPYSELVATSCANRHKNCTQTSKNSRAGVVSKLRAKEPFQEDNQMFPACIAKLVPPSCETRSNHQPAALSGLSVPVLLTQCLSTSSTKCASSQQELKQTPKRCLVLDNDETTGCYQLLSLFYNLHLAISPDHSPPPRQLMLEFLEKGAARPGTKELIRFACSLKQQGRLDSLIVFTAAVNTTGWVTFLVSILEEYAGVPPGSVDLVVSREDVLRNTGPTAGPILKDLRMICSDTSKTMIVDDKPQHVYFGNVVAVSPYEQHVAIDEVVKRIPCTPQNREFAEKTLMRDSLSNKPPSPLDFSQDRELFRVITAVDVFFSEGNSSAASQEKN